MRLAVVCHAASANARYRAVLPLRELERRGHSVCWPGDPSFEGMARGAIPPWDLLHVQQCVDERDLATIARLREHGVAVVWDSDDDLGAVPRGSASYQRLGGRRRIRRMFDLTISLARAAHLMTTTSEDLADRYRNAGVERVRVIENYLAPDDVRRSARRHQGLVVGIVAADEHRHDLHALRLPAALQELLRARDGVRIVAFGVDLKIRDHRYTHVRKVPPDALVTSLRDIDIGLAPLRDTHFNRARSNVKIKEYAAAGAMWLASPVGPYRGFGEAHGGLLVGDGDWFDVLSALTDDRARRVRLAQQAQAWADSQTIRHGGGMWEAAFRDAIVRARRERT